MTLRVLVIVLLVSACGARREPARSAGQAEAAAPEPRQSVPARAPQKREPCDWLSPAEVAAVFGVRESDLRTSPSQNGCTSATPDLPAEQRVFVWFIVPDDRARYDGIAHAAGAASVEGVGDQAVIAHEYLTTDLAAISGSRVVVLRVVMPGGSETDRREKAVAIAKKILEKT